LGKYPRSHHHRRANVLGHGGQSISAVFGQPELSSSVLGNGSSRAARMATPSVLHGMRWASPVEPGRDDQQNRLPGLDGSFSDDAYVAMHNAGYEECPRGCQSNVAMDLINIADRSSLVI
jgi:hypothetical protein